MLIFLVGAGLGMALVAFGAACGFIAARRRSGAPPEERLVDRGRVLRLLQELAQWTSEYSGSVSHYQDQLDEISDAIKQMAAGASDPEVTRIVGVLERIMQGNRALQQRLEAAEQQLERQTYQIQEYLSEARTDALTGLANRRAFDERLEEMFEAWKRGGPTFALLLVDIDHFKPINDRYGHQSGDEVLKQVAAALAGNLEGAYLVARFGGEEFAALMPVPLRNAAERADRLRRLVIRQPMRAEGRSIPVTISGGLAEPRDDTLVGALVRRADEALYAAKGRGRNRIYFHDGQQAVLVGAPEVVGPAETEASLP